jgi:hypothetical protein
MPYISQEDRKEIDKIVQLLNDDVTPQGRLNYLIFAYVKRCILPSYNNYKEVIGELECCKLEIYRKLIAPYEEKKMLENGDV